MSEHNLFYYPHASFTNAQLLLLKVAALYFGKLVLLDPVGASWDPISADHVARDAVRILKDASILEIVTPATVLAQYEALIAEAIRRDMGDREFLDLCEVQSRASSKRRWTLSLTKVPQDLQTDQIMRHLMGDFARVLARDSGQYRERAGANTAEYYKYAETGQAYDEYREGYGGMEYRYTDLPLALGVAGKPLRDFKVAQRQMRAKAEAEFPGNVVAAIRANQASGLGTLIPDLEIESLPDVFILKCRCKDCKAAVSPLASLVGLLDHALWHVKLKENGAGNPQPLTLEDLRVNFHQPFGDLSAACEELQRQVYQGAHLHRSPAPFPGGQALV